MHGKVDNILFFILSIHGSLDGSEYLNTKISSTSTITIYPFQKALSSARKLKSRLQMLKMFYLFKMDFCYHATCDCTTDMHNNNNV